MELIGLENLAKVFETTIAIMNKYEVPLTPENYTIFYYFVLGDNKELVDEIRGVLSKNSKLDDDYLYRTYISLIKKRENSELEKFETELRNTVTIVISQVNKLGKYSGESSNNVLESVKDLNHESSLKDVLSVVEIIKLEAEQLGVLTDTLNEELAITSEELSSMRKELDVAQQASRQDHLTGIANRLGLDEFIEDFGDNSYSLLMIDIDFFKKFNDTFGHVVGDKVLRFVATMISKKIRGDDFIARFGGEEFVVILPDTPLDGAKIVAENICTFFSHAKLKGSDTTKDLGKITVSIGVSEYKNSESFITVIERADSALYRAKENGRNRVETE